MDNTSRSRPDPDPDPGTPQSQPPGAGAPEREGSPTGRGESPVVHTPLGDPTATGDSAAPPPGSPAAASDPAAPSGPQTPADPKAPGAPARPGDPTGHPDPARAADSAPPVDPAPAADPAPPVDPGPPADSTPPADPGPGGEPVAEGPGPLGPSRRVSTAIRTAPNAVTLVRLLLMPVCAYLLATGRYGWGLVLTALVGSTDWVDGWLARRTGQVSRVGQLLDPLADRLLIASVAIALVVRGVLPWPAAVLLLGRDLLLLAGWPVLKRRGIEPPEVVFLGKAATLVLLFALPVLTLGATGLAVAGVAHLLGLALLWAGVVMYYLAGAVYVRMVLERLGHRERAGS
jgi:cardiolipin synthase (CMP-forming)